MIKVKAEFDTLMIKCHRKEDFKIRMTSAKIATASEIRCNRDRLQSRTLVLAMVSNCEREDEPYGTDTEFLPGYKYNMFEAREHF
jgi:hypothetical protein